MHCLSFRGVCHTAASDLFPFLLLLILGKQNTVLITSILYDWNISDTTEWLLANILIFWQGIKGRENNETWKWFQMKNAVRQGCHVWASFFLGIEWILRNSTADKRIRISRHSITTLKDLDLNDTIVLLSSKSQDFREKTSKLISESARLGLNSNVKSLKQWKRNTPGMNVPSESTTSQWRMSVNKYT